MRTPTYNWFQVLLRVFKPTEDALRVCLVDAASGAPWTKSEIVIPASSTVTADINLLTSFSRLDYFLNFKDVPTTVTKSLKYVVQNDAGTLTDAVSERMGGSINVSVACSDDGVDQFLEITNNEAFALTLTMNKSAI